MLKPGLIIEKKVMDGKKAIKFTVQEVSRTKGLSEKLEAVGFKLIECENMAAKTVTQRDDAITALLAQYFNTDGSSK